MREAQVIEQTAKRSLPDRSLPDVLVTIEFRAARRFRVIAVPDLHLIQTDGRIEMLQRLVKAFLADDVVSGNVRVAGIDAGADRNHASQTL